MDAIKPDRLVELGVPEARAGEAPEVTALVQRAKAGDADAFGGLMRLYERRVIAIGVQMGLSPDEAQDACQDAFIKVFRYIRGFRSGRSFFKWLYRIAIHAIYDHLRAHRRADLVSLEDVEGARLGAIRDRSAPPDRAAESSDLARRLMAGLDLLTRQERIVFVLRDLQEIGTDDIGRIMRLSQITIRRHCMSARQKLRDHLFPRGH